MAEKIFLVKLLHKVLRGNRDSRNVSLSKARQNSVDVKKEDSQTCRVCLTEGDIPIFGNLLLEDISENLRSFADIEIDVNDKYPKFICKTCYSHLQSAVGFRKTAKYSEMILRQQKTEIDDFDEGDDFRNESNVSEKDDKHDINTFICKKCDLTFDTFEKYADHIELGHENARHTCPHCNKSIKESYFQRHLALHTNATYVCDICGKFSIVKQEFYRHRQTHFFHLPFKCTLCPYRGRFSENLKMHMKTHTGEKPYQCDKCPARFVSKSNLNKHSNIHKDTYDIICDCGRGFYEKKKYEMHIKVDHRGIKEHICNICNKAFGYRKQMMKHQLHVHKREKLRSGRMPIYLQAEMQGKSDLDEIIPNEIAYNSSNT